MAVKEEIYGAGSKKYGGEGKDNTTWTVLWGRDFLKCFPGQGAIGIWCTGVSTRGDKAQKQGTWVLEAGGNRTIWCKNSKS